MDEDDDGDLDFNLLKGGPSSDRAVPTAVLTVQEALLKPLGLATVGGASVLQRQTRGYSGLAGLAGSGGGGGSLAAPL